MVAYLIHVEFTAAKYKFTAFLFSMYTILDLQWLQRTWGYLDLKTPTDTNETPTHSDHLTVTMKLHLTRTRIDFLISLINENGNPWLGTMCIVRSNSNSRFMFVRATVGVREIARKVTFTWVSLPPLPSPLPPTYNLIDIRQPNDFQSTWNWNSQLAFASAAVCQSMSKMYKYNSASLFTRC